MTVLRGLWRLTWLEIKIFLREPLGAIGSIVIPVLMYVVLGRVMGRDAEMDPQAADFLRVVLPVLVAVMILLNAVVSLIAIISIYREGGILKRLRATPLRSSTILSAHVLVKLIFTAITVALMVLAGRRYYPVDLAVPVLNVTLALLVSLFSMMAMGFLIASLVPTARFAQPIAGAIFYPMIGLSGLFYPIALMPPLLRAVAPFLPLTAVISLLRGMLTGDAWSAHTTDLASLAVVFVVCTALSARVFRWE
jgi:ABC-2 type transport system permease protein